MSQYAVVGSVGSNFLTFPFLSRHFSFPIIPPLALYLFVAANCESAIFLFISACTEAWTPKGLFEGSDKATLVKDPPYPAFAIDIQAD